MKSIREIQSKKKLKWLLITIALILGLIITVILALSIGTASIPGVTIFRILVNEIIPGSVFRETWSSTSRNILINVRLPRVIIGVLVGSSLAASGCVMQGLFKNPLASPYVLGVASGASFGAALGLVLGLSLYSLPLTAFIFASLAVLLVYNIARINGGIPTETLLLSGIAVGLFFSSLVSLLVYISGEKIYGIVFWTMGGLWASSWDKVIMMLPPIIIGIIVLFLFGRELNAMLLGEEQALHLGIEVKNLKKIILIFATLITAASISFVGTIGFVGLIIPHMMRIITGADHRILLPASTLFGGIFLVLADTLSRSIIYPTEIPVGIITAIFGVPFFIYLLRRKKGEMW